MTGRNRIADLQAKTLWSPTELLSEVFPGYVVKFDPRAEEEAESYTNPEQERLLAAIQSKIAGQDQLRMATCKKGTISLLGNNPFINTMHIKS